MPRLLQLDLISASTPSVARILKDKTLFRGGFPSWVNCPTAEEAKNNRIAAIKRLQRDSETADPAAEPLADILSACRPARRCLSGACPVCGRAFQRWWVSETEKLAAATNPARLHAISIVLPDHRVRAGSLGNLDPTRLKRPLFETIKNIGGLDWLVGAIDLSLNDDHQKGLGIRWQPQFYLFASTTRIDLLSKVLRQKYPSTDVVRRPVQIKECDGSAQAISYGFKTFFVRRIAYQTEVGLPENRRTCWHTRKVSLTAAEHILAMLWMHKVGFAGRLFLRGVRMTRNGQHVGLVKLKIKKLE